MFSRILFLHLIDTLNLFLLSLIIIIKDVGNHHHEKLGHSSIYVFLPTYRLLLNLFPIRFYISCPFPFSGLTFYTQSLGNPQSLNHLSRFSKSSISSSKNYLLLFHLISSHIPYLTILLRQFPITSKLSLCLNATCNPISIRTAQATHFKLL